MTDFLICVRVRSTYWSQTIFTGYLCVAMVSLLHCDLLEERNYLALSASSTLSAGPGTHQALTLLLSWFSYTHFPILRFCFREADGAWPSCSKEWSDQPDYFDTTAHCGLCPSHGLGWQEVWLCSHVTRAALDWPFFKRWQGCALHFVWLHHPDLVQTTPDLISLILTLGSNEKSEKEERHYLLCYLGDKLDVCWATHIYASCSDLGLGTEFLTLPERSELERKGWRLILRKAG